MPVARMPTEDFSRRFGRGTMTPLRIIVAGGSLGGLFAAILLQRDGHSVRVFERSSSGLGGRGAGLVAQQDVFDILLRIGAEDATQVGVVARDRITLDRAGQIVAGQEMPQMQISWDNLYRSVRSRFTNGAYLLGRGVASATRADGSASVHLDDGTVETADLIIGADGLGSVLRPAVTGAPSPNR